MTTNRCSDPSCTACSSIRIPISIGVYPRPLLSLPALIAIILGLAFAVGLATSGCDARAPENGTCALCAPSGILSCAGPGEDPCPGSAGASLPVCGVLAGYTVAATDCGGARINGLRCATSCAWQIGSNPSAEIFDAGVIEFPPGCTLPQQGEPGVCVVNCSDCQ